jgi:hypothetical protein
MKFEELSTQQLKLQAQLPHNPLRKNVVNSLVQGPQIRLVIHQTTLLGSKKREHCWRCLKLAHQAAARCGGCGGASPIRRCVPGRSRSPVGAPLRAGAAPGAGPPGWPAPTPPCRRRHTPAPPTAHTTPLRHPSQNAPHNNEQMEVARGRGKWAAQEPCVLPPAPRLQSSPGCAWPPERRRRRHCLRPVVHPAAAAAPPTQCVGCPPTGQTPAQPHTNKREADEAQIREGRRKKQSHPCLSHLVQEPHH